ncbi:MAG: YciI family protein [Microbacteriaceae bacterium]
MSKTVAFVRRLGEGLHPSSTGVRVHYDSDDRTVVDGPFTESKGLLAGFWIIQVKDRDEAIEWARRIPLPSGQVEVRQIFDISEFDQDNEYVQKEKEWRETSGESRTAYSGAGAAARPCRPTLRKRNTMTRPASAALAVLASISLLLAGCAAAEPSPPDAPPTPSSTGSATPAPAPGSALLRVDAVATAPEGSTLEIGLVVHRSFPADAAEASELRALLSTACGPDFVTDARLDGEAWGLVRVDVTAESTGDVDWPDELPISLVSAARGELGAAAVAASGEPLITPVDPARELGPCLVEQTPLGEEMAAPEIGYSERTDAAECSAGIASPAG